MNSRSPFYLHLFEVPARQTIVMSCDEPYAMASLVTAGGQHCQPLTSADSFQAAKQVVPGGLAGLDYLSESVLQSTTDGFDAFNLGTSAQIVAFVVVTLSNIRPEINGFSAG
jgi:hypothetical protein